MMQDVAAAFRAQPTLSRTVTSLETLPEWKGVLGLDVLARRIVFRAVPPFGAGALVGHEVTPEHLDRARLWFETVLSVTLSRRMLEDAVRIVASDAPSHPVADYLRGLSWDGQTRIDGWLEAYAGVTPITEPDARLVRDVAAKWLISCVARAMKPGCKVDTMLILEGKSYLGKSAAFRILASPRYFCDTPIDFASKDARQNIQGVWIYEIAELAGIVGRETSTVKAFLSGATDRFRAPYARAPETIPRSVVFCGTVNHGHYLKDRTGNRRFWVIRCEREVDQEGLAGARDQLWAEARHRYEAGEAWHLSREHTDLMAEEHETRMEHDAWSEIVPAWVASREGRPFTMTELLESALGLSAKAGNPRVTSRVAAILEELGYQRRRVASKRVRSYVYALPECPPSPLPLESFSGVGGELPSTQLSCA
jgi:putative DNA primase/helicase